MVAGRLTLMQCRWGSMRAQRPLAHDVACHRSAGDWAGIETAASVPSLFVTFKHRAISVDVTSNEQEASS